MSEQARIDELSLQLTEGIINTLSNAAMPEPQRKARCQVMITDTLNSERNDLKLQLEGKECEKVMLRYELEEWKKHSDFLVKEMKQLRAENQINQDIIVDLKRRIEEMEESVPPVYTEVVNERRRQDEQWGGTEHDDTHEPADWRFFIHKQLNAMMQPLEGRMTSAITDPANYRKRLINVAGLAIAAAESYDRKKEKQRSYKLYEDMTPEEQRIVDEVGYAMPVHGLPE